MTALVLVLGPAASATVRTRSNRLSGPAPTGDGVILIGGRRPATGFAKGRRCIETATYKVHASRRDGPGTAEVHARDIDIFYVLEGSATLVTGGRPVDAKTTAPDEMRAPASRAARRARSPRATS